MNHVDPKKRRILIVEDSATQREQLRFLLEEAGFSVDAANNGSEALAAAKETEHDLVISDIVMPEMDGYGLCDALRTDESLRHLPVILLTSLTDPRDVIRGLEAGANNFVRKPYTAEYLLGRIQNVLATAEVRKTAGTEVALSVRFRGKQYSLSQDRLQLLDVLLATYDDAVYQLADGDPLSIAGARLLVVEDSVTQSESLRVVLEGFGCSVVTASNGSEALAVLSEQAVDLVISDVVMPEMDGHALCKAIRAGDRLRDVPIILLTALRDPEEVIAGLEAGASNFMRKPCEPSYLAARVRNLLEGQKTRGQSSGAIDIVFAGQRHTITADRMQMLDLLLSSYDNAVEQNSELARARDELRILNEKLEARVAERTSSLSLEVATRTRLQERAERMNVALRAIREVNRLVRGTSDAAQLAQASCELLVERGVCRAAWIVIDGGLGLPQFASGAGWGDEFDVLRGRLERGLPPSCVARARAADGGIVLLDPNQSCGDCSLADRCLDAAAVVAPLRHAARDFGAIGLSLVAGVEIDADELTLLQEFSVDLGAALNAIVIETARAESEAKLRAVTHSAPDAVILQDPDGNVAYWNPAAENIFGYSEAEALGRNAHDLLMPERYRPQFEPMFAEFRRSGGGPSIGKVVALMAKHKDGHEIPVELARSTIGLHGGFWASAIIRDISERRQAEEALRSSEARYRALFDGAHDAMMTLAPPIWQFTSGNASAVAMFGARDEADFISRGPVQYSPELQPDGRPSLQMAAEVIEVALTKGSHFFEWTYRRIDGTTFPVTVLLTRTQIDGQVLLQATVRDVSDQKRAEQARAELEEQLRASQKLEAIGSLAGGVAHDFNNLLSVILSYTGFAIDELPEGDAMRADLLEVKSAGERAAELTRQLLAFSRKQVLLPVRLSLNQVAAGMEKMLQRILGEDIELVQHLAPDLGVTLADAGQMEQVLMNLMVNARDAMPNGGRLTIETANVELDGTYAESHADVTPGSFVVLVVSDTGHGMDAATRAKIFEPFFTTKEKGKGTGLGLPTVYGIVRQSGGHIWVYSEPGKGTTFKVYLPRDLSSDEATTLIPRRISTPATGVETILVVEDEEPLRIVALRILRAAGYTVIGAANGEEALSVAAEHAGTIHLLLTDVVMPRMSGRAVAEKLSEGCPALKILYMSGYTDNAIVHHGVLDSGTHLLGKPFTAAELSRRVREVLDERRPNAGAADADEERSVRPLDDVVLRALDEEVLARLEKAMVAARHDEILELVDSLRGVAPEAASELLRLAERFDYEGMRRLLGR